MESRVIIIGGGISGLATAFYLKQQGIRSILIEGSGRLGGLIRTDAVDGCDLEAGPDSFIAAKPAIAVLAKDLGIADRLMGSNDAARQTFIVRKGRLVPMPKGMVMMVPSEWKSILRSPLFSVATKLRFVRECSFKPRSRDGDFSIRDLVVDHFGEEALHYLTEPLLSGVYGGNAASLSARSVLPRFVDYEAANGSLIRGVRQTQGRTLGESSAGALFLSFQGGMQTLVDSLVSATRDSTEVLFRAVKSVLPSGKEWMIDLGDELLQTSRVVLACAAHQSAGLLSDASRPLSALLASIPYCSSTLVTLLFDRKGFAHPLNGFGFLVPPQERRTIAAVTWINTKFPSRVAPGLVAIRAFLVDPEAKRFAQTSDAEVLKLVRADLQCFMGIKTEPRRAMVYRWPKSMPQYVVGHAARVASIQAEVTRHPGLHLVSNYLDGVGIPDCVRNAKSAASEIKNHS